MSNHEAALRQAMGVLRDMINRSFDPGLIRNDLVRYSEDLFEQIEALINSAKRADERADQAYRRMDEAINTHLFGTTEDREARKKAEEQRNKALRLVMEYRCRSEIWFQHFLDVLETTIADEPPKNEKQTGEPMPTRAVLDKEGSESAQSKAAKAVSKEWTKAIMERDAAIAERDLAVVRIGITESVAAGLELRLRASENACSTWKERCERARTRLQLRGEHDADCAYYHVNDDGERLYLCNCGLDAALADEPPKDERCPKCGRVPQNTPWCMCENDE
jgi:hypothetical protein